MKSNSTIDPSQINGWGLDANPDNDPVYPMRDMRQEDKGGMNWPRPVQQATPIEVLKSNERPTLSAVFGTPTPPSGMSGFIRRRAFKYSESSWAHWLMLLFADRLNVIEGIFQDFGNGRFPNIFAEMGIRSEIKYNFSGFVKKIFITLAIIALVIALIVIDF